MNPIAAQLAGAKIALESANADRDHAMSLVRAAVVAAHAAGVEKKTIAESVGVTRATVYAILEGKS